jgi:O-methyltransferase
MTLSTDLNGLFPDARAQETYRRYAWTLMRAICDYFGVGPEDGSVLFDLDAQGNAHRLEEAPLEKRQALRALGLDWPLRAAASMAGLRRLENFQACIEAVMADKVPGDLIETGVWRGGACIFARGILDALGGADRTVWLADSFQGLPEPDGRFAADRHSDLHAYPELAVSLDQVKAQFDRFNLMSDKVQFLKGWFKDTLATAQAGPFAIARLDGDMYGSTMDALIGLYHRISPGGFIIIDDYGAVEACRQAVSDFRAERCIDTEIVPIDWTGVYWRLPRH